MEQTLSNTHDDTIAALATAPGSGAVAIVRLSGNESQRIAEQICGAAPAPRRAELRAFRDASGELIDTGLALYFPGPDSYTGQDVVEFQIHGSPVISEWLLEAIVSAGARAAEPGEFTLRAFLNDKLDLAQAEAVADLVASHSRAAARAAGRSLSGSFSERVAAIQSSLTHLRVQLEAHLDFPDEEIDPESGAALQSSLRMTKQSIAQLQREAHRGVVLRDGLNLAIAGPPNAGKSSLLNRLAGYSAAIVTDIPGTTRDPLREHLVLDGLPITIVDTAGLRATTDPIEKEGLRRAHVELERADRVLWVSDVMQDIEATVAEARTSLSGLDKVSFVFNKIDLLDKPPSATQRLADNAVLESTGAPAVAVSALTGSGFENLTRHLKELAGWSENVEGSFSARRRHLDAIERALNHLDSAEPLLISQSELAAEELRNAQQSLSEVTGELTSDDLLGEIFSSFCIGK